MGVCAVSGVEPPQSMHAMTHTLYDMINVNNTKGLQKDEICEWLRTHCPSISPEDLGHVSMEMEVNQNGKVEYQEFDQYFEQQWKTHSDDEWLEAVSYTHLTLPTKRIV
eukprot:TRINITY_DN12296_c0_g1_i4.p1 TRINITY_DN12296_c0_g1~~TRINITY_DN12296_c0_g1_i4.p1  ORF type:complete len:109 (+),score=25.04 TRINITY_DN12296_c0_g1_i4:148-474(+)